MNWVIFDLELVGGWLDLLGSDNTLDGGILEIVGGIVGPDRRRDATGLQQHRENQALLFMPD